MLGPIVEYLYHKIDQISSLTIGDNVKLTAAMYYHFEDKFKCEDKFKEIEKRAGAIQAKVLMEKDNGCGVYRSEFRYEIDGIRYHECVCGLRSNRLAFFFDVLSKFDLGIMPYKGSYLEQPAKMVGLLNRLSEIKNDMELRQIKEQQKQNG